MRILLVLSLLLAGSGLLAQPNPVTNGGFEEIGPNGVPVDWEAVGQVVKVTDEAHSGARALRIERGKGLGAGPETGLNRAWKAQSGQRGAMLAETKGGLVFWYKVVSAEPNADVSVQVIPMNAQALEEVGAGRVIHRLSPDATRAGEWREGRLAYDFSGNPSVKWVHVGARLTGGAAVLLLDDYRYVERVGPLLQIEKVHLYPDERQPARAAVLTMSVANGGDEPSEEVSLRLETTPGLRAESPAPLNPLPVGGAVTVKLRLTGPLNPGTLGIIATDGRSRTDHSLPLAPRVEVESLLAKPGLSAPGGPVEVMATLWNRGTATAAGISATLNTPAGPSTLTGPPLAPGRKGTVRWRFHAPRKIGAYPMGCIAGIPDMTQAPEDRRVSRGMLQQTAGPAVLTVTDALQKPAGPLAGLLGVRRGSDRTLGELRFPGAKGTLAARLPHMGRVTVRLPGGATQTITARYGPARRDPTGAARMQADATDRAGGRWTFRAVARAVAPTATRLEIQTICNQPRTVLVFEGPVLLAGEGSTGAAMSEAVFPGLEWLAPGEVSSSDLDIASDHADRPRYVPHPHKVTIPVMGVKTPGGAVGLLWDMGQAWDGRRRMPQPVFAVPDRLDGVEAHRMGLIAPNVTNGLPENALRSKTGYALPANRPLRLAATLYADPAARDSLAAMDAWFRHYRPQPVLPAPRGTDRAQMAWSMAAYMKTLWVSPEEGWMPFLGGPAIWRKPVFDASFAFDLRQAARILSYHPDAQKWQDRLEWIRARLTRPQADDRGFLGGDPLPVLGGMAAQTYQWMGVQAADGSWRFDADRRDPGVFKGMDYHIIGPDDAAEVGTTARTAYEILLYARLSGDPEAYRAGAQALEFIRRFTVPRAAQVWEVPVHTPDILAAADAVDACLEAYRYTQRDGKPGDARWLREAKRWARAGLPFVYVWNAPGKPWMRYGSIPVFGATWFQGSWFGNIVQWNGLRYAYALLKLHEYDPKARWGGLSWRDLALGITRCAMYQQSTQEKNLGLWPDSFHTITSARADWDFAPRIFLKNVFAMLGRDEEPRTVAVSVPGGGTARVSASAPELSARLEGDTLKVTAGWRPDDTGSVLIAGIARPAEVRLDKLTIPPQDSGGTGRGWRYDAANAMLRLTARESWLEAEIRGVRAASGWSVARPMDRVAFEFDSGPEGWIAASDLEPLRAENGALVVRCSGIDPYMHRYLLRVSGSTVREIVLKVRGSGDGGGQLYWTTREASDWDEPKSLRFAFPTDGAWHEVVVPVGQHPLWHGQTITALRIDPGSTPGAEIAIDWIRAR